MRINRHAHGVAGHHAHHVGVDSMSDLQSTVRYAMAPTTIVFHAGLVALAIGGAMSNIVVGLAGAIAVAAGFGARALRTDANVRRASELLNDQRLHADAAHAKIDAGLAEVRAAVALTTEANDRVRADLDELNGVRERAGRALDIRISRSERQLTDVGTDVDELTTRVAAVTSEVTDRCTALEGDVDRRLSALEGLRADIDHLLGSRSWSSTRRRKDEKPETHLSVPLATIPGPETTIPGADTTSTSDPATTPTE